MKNSSQKKVKDLTLTQAYTELGKHAYWAARNPEASAVAVRRNEGLMKALLKRIDALKRLDTLTL